MSDLLVLGSVKTLLIAAAVFIPFERLAAARPAQRIFRQGWATDALTGLVNGLLLYGVVVLLLAGIDTVAAKAIPDLRLWVSGRPTWMQAALALALGDLGVYAAHRLTHTLPWLWRFHAVHHAAEEMDWLVGLRFHAVDQLVLRTGALAPMVALNVNPTAAAVFVAVFGWQAWLTHANVRLPFGPLRWIVVSPEFHHWHHAVDREAHDSNFANIFACWDVLFGTAYLPRDRQPVHFGIDEPVPAGLLARFLHPFHGRR
jgi:sterol desaturase/sphingolipid hydroxylase (fatty acid hydroxylase superfamily)